MTVEELLEMPNWPQSVMPQILINLQALASIAPEIVADKVEGPRLVKFVNDVDPLWAKLVEASKTVKPQEPPAVENQAATAQAQPESLAQGQPEGKDIEPFEPLPGQKFRFPVPECGSQPDYICFRCPRCHDLLALPVEIVDTQSRSESKNETAPQAETTSLRPHVKKMAGN